MLHGAPSRELSAISPLSRFAARRKYRTASNWSLSTSSTPGGGSLMCPLPEFAHDLCARSRPHRLPLKRLFCALVNNSDTAAQPRTHPIFRFQPTHPGYAMVVPTRHLIITTSSPSFTARREAMAYMKTASVCDHRTPRSPPIDRHPWPKLLGVATCDYAVTPYASAAASIDAILPLHALFLFSVTVTFDVRRPTLGERRVDQRPLGEPAHVD